jgi:hypothetical protein
MFSRQLDLVEQSAQFTPDDRLVLLKPITCFGTPLQRGELVPHELGPSRMRQLIRTRFAKLLPAGAAVPAVVVAKPIEPAAPVVVADAEFKCDECPRTFKKKLNLGAHMRSHRG